VFGAYFYREFYLLLFFNTPLKKVTFEVLVWGFVCMILGVHMCFDANRTYLHRVTVAVVNGNSRISSFPHSDFLGTLRSVEAFLNCHCWN
jgi:hypothetical protein